MQFKWFGISFANILLAKGGIFMIKVLSLAKTKDDCINKLLLKNPVKEVRYNNKTFEYFEDGRLKKLTFKIFDNYFSETYYYYDNNLNLIKFETRGAHTGLKFIQKFKYYDLQNEIITEQYSGDGILVSKKIKNFKNNTETQIVFGSIDRIKNKQIKIFNDKNEVLEISDYNFGKMYAYTYYSYDYQKNIVYEKKFDVSNEGIYQNNKVYSPLRINKYSLVKNSDLIQVNIDEEFSKYNKDAGLSEIIFKDGFILKENKYRYSERKSRRFYPQRVFYDYDFDKYNNWTKYTKIINGEKSEVVSREIIYY